MAAVRVFWTCSFIVYLNLINIIMGKALKIESRKFKLERHKQTSPSPFRCRKARNSPRRLRFPQMLFFCILGQKYLI